MLSALVAAVYTRQSKGQKRSIEEQESDCRAACRANGWDVREVYADTTSASRFARKGRPDWERLLADMAAQRFGVLVMWESSRGDRTLTSWSALLDKCRDLGVRIHVVTHERTYNLANNRDWETLATDGVSNASESNKTSERNRRTVEANAIKGRPHGPSPYGYERRYDPKTGDLVEQRPNLATAPVVQEIVTRLAAGDPISAVTTDLNRRGIPSPKGGTWYRSQVRKLALNPLYLGKRSHKGELYDAIWPALVSAKDHNAVKRRLTAPERKVTRPGRVKYLLSYLATCGECGAPLKGATGRNTQRNPLYACIHGCTYGPMKDIDEHVSYYIRRELYKPEMRHWIGQQNTDDAAVIRAREEAEGLEAQLDEMAKMVGSGVTARQLAIAEAELRPRITAALARAQAGTSSIPDPDDILAMWFEAGLHWQRERISQVCSRIALYKAAKRGRGPFDGGRVEFEFRNRPGVRERPPTARRVSITDPEEVLALITGKQQQGGQAP